MKVVALLAAITLSQTVQATDETTAIPKLVILERTTKPLLKCDRPWEEFCISYCTVLRIGDQWRLWYDSCDRSYRNDNDCYLCYARSKDGIHWEKPSLGIYSYHGGKDNNILGFGTHATSVFLDEKAPPVERFKAVGVRQSKGKSEWWVYGATSPDGLHWKWIPKPLLAKNSDTATICIHDGDAYRLFVRMWSGGGAFSGQRIVGYSQSNRFGDFSNPVAILSTDKNDPAKSQFYNSAATKLASDLYLLLPSSLMSDGTLPVYAAFSRDGRHFSRLDRKPLLGPGQGFDNKGLYFGPGAVPAEKPGTYWFYYLGVSVPHDGNVPQKVRRDGGIGRLLIRVEDIEAVAKRPS